MPCPAKSDPQLQPILAQGLWLGSKSSSPGLESWECRCGEASGWPPGGKRGQTFFRVILHKILPTPRAAALGSGSPRNEKGASRCFSRPPSSRLLPMCCRRSRQKPVPVPQTPSPFVSVEVPSLVANHQCHPSGSFQLDCRHLVVGSGGHIGPSSLSPLLSSVPSLLFFLQPAMDWNFVILFSGLRMSWDTSVPSSGTPLAFLKRNEGRAS